MSANEIGTEGAIAGTDVNDSSTPAAPFLFDKKKIMQRVSKRLREKTNNVGVKNAT